MSLKKCKSCQGEYEPEPVDGTKYFHTCPESVAPEDRRNENVKSTASKDAGSVKLAGKGSSVK